MTIYHENKLYSLGGRTYGEDEQAILDYCECYDFDENYWEMIAPMQERRCSGFCFIYHNFIYVAGGYTGHLTRNPYFEKYDIENNK